MFSWFGKKDRPAATHAPWQAGQYVTYVLNRDDGTWAAFALHVLGQADDGAWAIRGDFKTVGGECHVWFRSDPQAKPGGCDPVPSKQQLGRRVLPERETPDAWVTRPEMQITLALNLFLVRQVPGALDALTQPGRPARHACGIDTVYPFVSPAPNFMKHHDLSPRVPITGVAGMTINGKQNPLAVTSFGRNDPAAGAVTYEDYVDWSHARPTVHEGFTVSYPATWFLFPQRNETPGETTLLAQLGGNTCAVTFSVRLRSGVPDEIQRHRLDMLARLRTPANGLVPDSRPLRYGGDSEGVGGAWNSPGVVGVFRAGLFSSPDGTRLAQLNLSGCVSAGQPDREDRLAVMDPAFQGILESMNLTSGADEGRDV